MALRLIRPTAQWKNAVLEYKREHFEYGETEISGGERLDCMESYEEWLQYVTDNASAQTVSPDWVVTDLFLAVDGKDRLVGVIDLRHWMNDYLQDYGNCGYSVRPTERGNGYAAEMLGMIKKIAVKNGMESLHMATFRDNIASVKTIVKNGGVWERSFLAEGKPADMYVIHLERRMF